MSASVPVFAPSPEVAGLPTRIGGVRTRLGVMGGTFDPIHYGHLVTAEEALHQFELDEVLFVPTGRPWMKEHGVVSPPEDRYLMTVIATASNPLFGVSRIEVDRDGPTYAVDTLRELRHERGQGTDLFFVTGADAVLEIVEQWKQPDELFALAHFIAATRPGFDLEAFEAHAPTKHPGITVMSVPRRSRPPMCGRGCRRADRSAIWSRKA